MKSSFVDVGADGVGMAAAAAEGTAAAERVSAARLRRLLTTAALATVVTLAVACFGPLLGMHLPPITLVIIACGALALDLAPARPLETVSAVGFLALASTNRVYAFFHLILVVALYVCRRRTLALAVVLAGLAIVLPKHLFAAHYHDPGFYNWINEPSLALAIFVTARWWREGRDGRSPDQWKRASLPAFAALYLFPGHAANPIVYGATDLFRARRIDASGVLWALALVASKALAHTAIGRFLPAASYAGLNAAGQEALSRGALWGVVMVNYLDLALILSGTADLAVMIARLYGWSVPFSFRWALLAWNPVELWRRWGLYNRRLLLGLVYFPLGGGRRRRILNVMLTFLASALIMHTGWFGSKYWRVGLPGWRDESLYFLLQGIAVCACLLYGQWRRGRGPSVAGATTKADRTLRWSWHRLGGTVATQMTSALIHVVILAQAMPLESRFRLMARCLGVR